ncbi:NAD+ synthase [Thermofilum pendens]|uniref:NH(3)-dependent NAD(+) synthetase n=1 Tax=Thermofilum pendens (strain DSM 2475 / Hrk 5) TaxID=368408 RepID=A1RZ14_THEPD|nr:NAD+ synthase [Thermofilum pendens]ABL78444.1 NH(3)-dependent NAD(+) synthetase [Thermofilum pendens Hrk 5]
MGVSGGVLPELDWRVVEEVITRELRRYVFEEAGKSGGVVGVSGGVDSAVTLLLTARALGPENTYALIMPSSATPEEDLRDAYEVVRIAGLPGGNVETVDIEPILSRFEESLGPLTRVERGNLAARVRMCILHARAYRRNSLVIGTGDKSELLLGYFTKYGDGGVDVLPIGDLYKTQVRRLGLHLGLPERIAFKPSSPRLWPGHVAEEELKLTYEVADKILYLLFDRGVDPSEVPGMLGVGRELVERVLELHRRSEHKRRPPYVIKVGV